jgi:hypothetical protein
MAEGAANEAKGMMTYSRCGGRRHLPPSGQRMAYMQRCSCGNPLRYKRRSNATMKKVRTLKRKKTKKERRRALCTPAVESDIL